MTDEALEIHLNDCETRKMTNFNEVAVRIPIFMAQKSVKWYGLRC